MATTSFDDFVNQRGRERPGDLAGAFRYTDTPKLVIDKDPKSDLFLRTPERYGVTAYRKPDTVVDVNTGIAWWYNMTDSQRALWGQKLFDAGMIRDAGDTAAAFNIWQDAVKEAASFYTYGKRRVTPWQVLDYMRNLQPGGGTSSGFPGGSGGGGTGYNGPRSRTSRSKDTSIPDASTIKTGVTAIFTDAVGRAPTAGELSQYTAYFQRAAKKNPRVTVTTARYDKYGAQVDTTTKQSGGIDLNQLGKDKAQADPEYGAYQAATTYMNALLQAIGSP